MSGTVLYQGTLFPNGVEGISDDLNVAGGYGFIMYGGDPEKLLVSVAKFPSDQGADNDYPTYFLLLDLKDNMKPTLLWTATK